MSTLKPDSYRLRMVALNWYLFLYRGGEKIEELGPFTFKEANQKAETLGLPDGDRE